MKNSLFKRAVAAVATVPLAFTQCLTIANAESNDAAKLAASAQVVAEDSKVTLASLLAIKPGETYAEWNTHVFTALTAQEIGGQIDIEKYKDKIVSKAGKFKEFAEYVISLVSDAKYEIDGNGDLVITAKVADFDFTKNVESTPGEAITNLADEYNVPGLKEIDLSSIKTGGEVKIFINTSDLQLGTKLDVHAEYKTADGTIGLGELPAFAKQKAENARAAAINEIAAQFPADKVEEATNKFNAEIDKFVGKISKAENYENRIPNSVRFEKKNNVAEVIAAANNILEKRNINRRIPSTASAIASNSIIVGIVEDIAKKAGSVASISADDFGKLGDSLRDITIDLNAGSGVATAFFDDAEKNQVKAWVEGQGNTYISSEKKITVKSNFKNIKTTDPGDIDVKVERVLVTAPGTTTSTSSTTTTTSSNTTSKTTSSATSSKTTSSNTTSNTTSSATSSKTTSKTTSSVTSSKTTSSNTTSKTTSSATTSKTTSKTTSSVTSSKTTSSETTSKTTSSVTTSKTTSKTTSSVTSSKTTSSETTSKTTSSSTSSKTTSSNTTSKTTSSTSSNTSSSTTSTVSTTLPEATTSLVGSYVTFDTKPAFYVSIDEEFSKEQFSNVVLHNRYVEGYTLNNEKVNTREFELTEDITDKVSFGDAKPGNTYDRSHASFMYEVPVLVDGKELKLINGETATVTAYIALKGDANLDNLVDSNDASQVLAYYASVSTNKNDNAVYEETLSKSELVKSPTDEYEEFAAFLADVHTSADKPVARTTKKDKRLVDANDASKILAFYAKNSSSDYVGKTAKEIWDEVLKND